MNDYEQARSLVLVMLSGIHNPTSEIIRQKVSLVISMLKAEGNLESIDEDYLIKDIESRCEVWKGRATVLKARQKDHRIWLPAQKSQIKWKFWSRYSRFL